MCNAHSQWVHRMLISFHLFHLFCLKFFGLWDNMALFSKLSMTPVSRLGAMVRLLHSSVIQRPSYYGAKELISLKTRKYDSAFTRWLGIQQLHFSFFVHFAQFENEWKVWWAPFHRTGKNIVCKVNPTYHQIHQASKANPCKHRGETSNQSINQSIDRQHVVLHWKGNTSINQCLSVSLNAFSLFLLVFRSQFFFCFFSLGLHQ